MGLGAFSFGEKRLGVWRELQGTGDLTSAIRVLTITPLILAYRKIGERKRNSTP